MIAIIVILIGCTVIFLLFKASRKVRFVYSDDTTTEAIPLGEIFREEIENVKKKIFDGYQSESRKILTEKIENIKREFLEVSYSCENVPAPFLFAKKYHLERQLAILDAQLSQTK